MVAGLLKKLSRIKYYEENLQNFDDELNMLFSHYKRLRANDKTPPHCVWENFTIKICIIRYQRLQNPIGLGYHVSSFDTLDILC